jgi:hypothetical protein
MPKKKEVNLADILYNAYPHSDLLSVDPVQDCRSLDALARKVTIDDCGDTFFRFLAVEMLEGGEGTLDGAIRVVERAREDVEAVLAALVKARGNPSEDNDSLRVIISVTNGVADVVAKPKGIAVSIFDYDVEGAEPSDARLSKDSDGHACFVSEWPAPEVVTSR